jgi:hypothetical protein
MLFDLGLYLSLGLAMVVAMAVMILRIGTILGECPQSGRAARAAVVTISCGYAMIGFGGVAIIGTAIPLLELGAVGILPSLGLAALCLGLGFSNAVATLRAVVREAGPQPQPAPSTPDSMASAA